ncbi:MAG: peptidylprolyl isomerase [Spirochaetes bacterium]|nr:peptidylprolyl isomerase [Spirochaetota bacterium]
MKKAENGDTIKVHYTGTLNDGTVFDTSKNREPLEFTIGSGQVIPGFDLGVIGMEINDKKTLNISCAEAYGERREELMFDVPKTDLPEGINPQVGQQLQMQNNDGQNFIVVISEINDSSIKIDANHPMAGEDLNFDIELVEISA